MATAMSLELGTNVQYIKGVGPKLGELLAKRDIHSVGDLIDGAGGGHGW